MLRDAYDKSHSGIRSSNDYSSRNSSSSSVSRNKDSRSSGGAEGKEKEPPSSTGTLELETKLPEWNNDIQSLVLKFNGARVLAASAKNFLMCEKGEKSKPVLQFGKCEKGKFVLDFRSPVAAVQAFGIALSVCNWKNTFETKT
jgi:hypothetical protein